MKKRFILSLICGILILGIATGCGNNKAINDPQSDAGITPKENEMKNRSETQNRNKTINDYSWKDFVISIDNHIITMGTKVKELETYGFIPNKKNYNTTLGKGQNVRTEMEYKNSNGNTVVFYPQVYNAHDNAKTVNETEILYFDIDTNFIKNVDVKLPGGILLKEDTTIDQIVASMGNYTKKIARGYYWEDNNSSSIYVNFDPNGKIYNIQYSYNMN